MEEQMWLFEDKLLEDNLLKRLFLITSARPMYAAANSLSESTIEGFKKVGKIVGRIIGEEPTKLFYSRDKYYLYHEPDRVRFPEFCSEVILNSCRFPWKEEGTTFIPETNLINKELRENPSLRNIVYVANPKQLATLADRLALVTQFKNYKGHEFKSRDVCWFNFSDRKFYERRVI
jgi:hypothetical protein